MENKWHQTGNRFDVGSVAAQKDLLPNGIYNLEADMTGLYLNRLQDEFDFGYKLYGIQDKFITRVINTFNNTKGNLGILMNGIKGTGKSVTAKMLCNRLNLPIILINKGFGGIPDYINSIQQEVVILIDEFEKVFNKEQDNGSLLTVMDGVLDNGFRRVFLLTTNQLRVNDNLLQRPGRVRYLKTFSDLDRETIEVIVNDCLIHVHHKDEVIKFISKLELITVDIVKAIVTEVNIHNESPEEFKDVFNVKQKDDVYNVYVVKDEVLTKIKTIYDIDELMDEEERRYFNVNIPNQYGSYTFNKFINEEDLVFEGINSVLDKDHDNYSKIFRIEKVRSFHPAYMF